jgi:hypothetical protein
LAILNGKRVSNNLRWVKAVLTLLKRAPAGGYLNLSQLVSGPLEIIKMLMAESGAVGGSNVGAVLLKDGKCGGEGCGLFEQQDQKSSGANAECAKIPVFVLL